MTKRLISDIGGIKTTMLIDGDTFTINKTQDVTGHLQYNKILANEIGKDIRSDAYNRVASIPASLIVKWKWEEGLDVYNPDHAKRLAVKLNSNEFRHLRTSELII